MAEEYDKDARIAELDATLASYEVQRRDDRDRIAALTAERDALAAVIEQVKAWLGTEDDWADDLEGSWPAPIELNSILSTAPSDALRAVKAAVLEEAAGDVLEGQESIQGKTGAERISQSIWNRCLDEVAKRLTARAAEYRKGKTDEEASR